MIKRALLMLALLPAALGAQDVVLVDSVQVQIYDMADVRIDVTPEDFRGFRGDTVTFQAVAVDTITGDTIPAVFTWSTDNPNAVNIDPVTGFTTFLSRGQHTIIVDANPIFNLEIYELMADGSVVLLPDTGWEFTLGVVHQLCAYGFDVQNVPVLKSSDICPNVIVWTGGAQAPQGPPVLRELMQSPYLLDYYVNGRARMVG